MFGRKIKPMPREFDVLARYNAEVARGIVHTPEWRAKMAELQERFNEWAWNETDGDAFIERYHDPRLISPPKDGTR